MSERVDKLAEFRCKKCGSGTTYVKQGSDETHKIRVCRRCGYEENLDVQEIQKKIK
jgi:DNA-directed RNA polymerase subunit M/transcription elongation factor TFIIS